MLSPRSINSPAFPREREQTNSDVNNNGPSLANLGSSKKCEFTSSKLTLSGKDPAKNRGKLKKLDFFYGHIGIMNPPMIVLTGIRLTLTY